jgi:hypothetical protein
VAAPAISSATKRGGWFFGSPIDSRIGLSSPAG